MSRPRTSTAETLRSSAVATLPATTALAVLTVVTAAGMGRLFNSTSYLGPVVGAAIAAHGLAWLWRRLGLGSVAALLLSAAGIVLVTTWVVFPHTTVVGLPSATTFDQATSQLSQAHQQLQELTTPAPVTTGFLLGSVLIVGILAVLADWAAFRHRSTLEATVPSLALFIYTAALGTSRERTLAVATYLAALIAFVLVSESSRRASTMPWLTSRAGRGLTPLLRGGATLGTIAVVAALVIGPNLPGARSAAAVDLRHLTQPGPSQRTTISPLVDIRSQLVKPSDVELFTVATTGRSYWRLTSLDTFDGAIWSANQSYRTAGVELPSSASAPSGVAPGVKQAFSISNLSSVWAPAAYRPSRLAGIPDASYNPESGSIITPSATPDGLTYQVTSDIPNLDPTELTQDGPDPPGIDLSHYLSLPAGIPDSIRQTATQVVRGETTDYGKALALQNWFRDNFRYNLNVPPGHDDNAMVRFLSARQGYCEQFAGTYAVMARAVGLPTRVAVGFTPGQLEGDGLYHVRALNAHAWPEVLLGRYGWVSFEPTPGRGEPGAEAYTGVAPAQAGPVDTPPQSGTGAPGLPASPATSAPLTTLKPSPNLAHAGPTAHHTGPFPSKAVAAIGTAVALALAWVVGIPLLVRRRRLRRRAAAHGADRVMVAWAEASDSLALMGVRRQASETLEEHARRAARSRVAPAEVPTALSTLAQDASVASYSPNPLGNDVVSRSVVAAAVIEGAVWGQATWWRRLRWRVDPRQLIRVNRDGGGWQAHDPDREPRRVPR